MLNQQQQPENNKCVVDESFLVVLDSRNADSFLNGSMKSSVIYNFAQSVTEKKGAIQVTCCVVSFVCPVSFYQINYTNCMLSIVLNSTPYFIHIPNGNYTVQKFIAAMVTLLPAGFSITLNSINNKLTMTHTTYDFEIIGFQSTVGSVMGFNSSTNYFSTGKVLNMPFCVNFSGLNNINIYLENINTPNIDSKSKTKGGVIASVNVNSPPGGVIMYEKKNSFSFVIDYDTLNYLQVDLMDDLENFLDLNNQDWNLTLQFTKKIEKQFRFSDTFEDILGNPYPKFQPRDSF